MPTVDNPPFILVQPQSTLQNTLEFQLSMAVGRIILFGNPIAATTPATTLNLGRNYRYHTGTFAGHYNILKQEVVASGMDKLAGQCKPCSMVLRGLKDSCLSAMNKPSTTQVNKGRLITFTQEHRMAGMIKLDM